jgi:hypothetical protein
LLGIHNVVPGVVAAGGGVVAGALVVPAATEAMRAGAAVQWCARAEHVVLDPAGPPCATVVDRVDTGSHAVVEVVVDGGPQLRAHVPDAGPLRAGDRCAVGIAAGAATAWPAGGVPAAAPVPTR